MVYEVMIVLPILLIFPLVMFNIVYRNEYAIWNRDPAFNEKYKFLVYHKICPVQSVSLVIVPEGSSQHMCRFRDQVFHQSTRIMA